MRQLQLEYTWNSRPWKYAYDVTRLTDSEISLRVSHSSDAIAPQLAVVTAGSLHPGVRVNAIYKNGFFGQVSYWKEKLQDVYLDSKNLIQVSIIHQRPDRPTTHRLNPRRLFIHWWHVREQLTEHLPNDIAKGYIDSLLQADRESADKLCSHPTIETTKKLFLGAKNEKELLEYFVCESFRMPKDIISYQKTA